MLVQDFSLPVRNLFNIVGPVKSPSWMSLITQWKLTLDTMTDALGTKLSSCRDFI